MKLRNVIATGATVLALTASVSAVRADSIRKPKGTVWQWTEFADVIDGDNATPTVTYKDGVFSTSVACWTDVRSKYDPTAPPPCPLDGVTDASCGPSGVPYTFYRCLRGLYGTPVQ